MIDAPSSRDAALAAEQAGLGAVRIVAVAPDSDDTTRER
jgi:hypothetical protein